MARQNSLNTKLTKFLIKVARTLHERPNGSALLYEPRGELYYGGSYPTYSGYSSGVVTSGTLTTTGSNYMYIGTSSGSWASGVVSSVTSGTMPYTTPPQQKIYKPIKITAADRTLIKGKCIRKCTVEEKAYQLMVLYCWYVSNKHKYQQHDWQHKTFNMLKRAEDMFNIRPTTSKQLSKYGTYLFSPDIPARTGVGVELPISDAAKQIIKYWRKRGRSTIHS